MKARSYKFWAISSPGFSGGCESFLDLMKDVVIRVHNDHLYLKCNVECSSNQLKSNSPPCSFNIKVRVEKSNDDKSKNFDSKSLLDKELRIHDKIADFTWSRIY